MSGDGWTSSQERIDAEKNLADDLADALDSLVKNVRPYFNSPSSEDIAAKVDVVLARYREARR